MSDDDLKGGAWAQDARELYVEAAGWIRGHHVPTAIHSVRNYATLADSLGTSNALEQLNKALANLEVEIERYQRRMAAFREQVGLLHALVLRARDEAPDQSDQQLEDERIRRLVDASDPGILGDDVLRRISRYHRP